MNKHREEKAPLSDETIKSLRGLGEILRRIHDRLVKEGYRVENGVLYSPDGKVIYSRKD